jgi:hypothetical protein
MTRIILTLLAFTVVITLARPIAVLGAQPILCSPPVSVSKDVAAFSAFAHIAPDRYGRLHMVWSSGVVEGRNEEQVETDTVFYTIFANGAWAQPVDILTDSAYATADSIAVTADDGLLVSWRTRSGLNVSRAPLQAAGSASNWTTRDLAVGNVSSSDLFVDSNGRVHLAYTMHEPAQGSGGVGYVWSDDGGWTWSSPVEFASVDARAIINSGVRVYATDDGFINMVWQRNAAENAWLPTGVWYASSPVGGNAWSEPQEVFSGARAAQPNLSEAADRLYMSWLRGVGYEDSKYLRSSTDGGRTWMDPQLQISNLQGMNGAMPILVDSAGTEHWIMSGDKEGKTRIWHTARSAGVSWPEPNTISGELQDSEFPDAVIVGGNELHIVWNDFVEDDIYHVICSLQAPAVPLQQAPAESVQLKNTPAPIASAPALATPIEPTATPEPARPAEKPLAHDDRAAGASTGQTLATALLPVAALIGAVFIWRRMRLR